MTRTKEKRSFSNFGFSTILLAFVMICVVIFSALSLVTAQSDYKLSKKVADKTALYYEAEERAYEKMAYIDKLLKESYSLASDETDYYSKIDASLTAYGTFAETPDGYCLSFNEHIATDQYLSVKLIIHYPRKGTDTFIETAEWKSVYKVNIPEDETLNLIQ